MDHHELKRKMTQSKNDDGLRELLKEYIATRSKHSPSTLPADRKRLAVTEAREMQRLGIPEPEYQSLLSAPPSELPQLAAAKVRELRKRGFPALDSRGFLGALAEDIARLAQTGILYEDGAQQRFFPEIHDGYSLTTGVRNIYFHGRIPRTRRDWKSLEDFDPVLESKEQEIQVAHMITRRYLIENPVQDLSPNEIAERTMHSRGFIVYLQKTIGEARITNQDNGLYSLDGPLTIHDISAIVALYRDDVTELDDLLSTSEYGGTK